MVKNHVNNMCFPVYDNIVYALSRFMPVGCGWPGPAFGPVVLYFLACIQPDDGHSSIGQNM